MACLELRWHGGVLVFCLIWLQLPGCCAPRVPVVVTLCGHQLVHTGVVCLPGAFSLYSFCVCHATMQRFGRRCTKCFMLFHGVCRVFFCWRLLYSWR
jgi:hypothetical protein